MEFKTIGRYEVIRELGRGGMATVYLAHDPYVKRQVAVKLLPRQFTDDEHFRARFRREAEMIAALEHPAIVPIYDFGEHHEQLFIVMRYMSGGSLADRLAEGPPTPEDVATIFKRLARGLDEAHRQGIIHRDLKPGNILFDRHGEAYVADFGIAKWTETTTDLTQGGGIGTPAYLSPEQAHGDRPVDGRSDVYACGVILFEILTGKPPYEGDTPMQLAMKHILDPVPDLRKVAADLPVAWNQVIQRALAKSPEHRYQTVSQFAQAIEKVAAGKQPTRQPPPEPVQPTYPDTEAYPKTTPFKQPEDHPIDEQPQTGHWRWLALLLGGGGLAVLLVVIFGGLALYQVINDQLNPAATFTVVVLTQRSTATPTAETSTLSGQSVEATATVTPTRPPTASGPVFSNFRFCDRPCDEPGAQQPDVFPEASTEVYASWDYAGMETGMEYVRTWSFGDEEWVRYHCIWEGDESGTFDLRLWDNEGLRSGVWTLTIAVENKVIARETVEFAGTHDVWTPAGQLACPDFP